MYGQMTAGSWIYIGTQGILQGTYETFAELARRHFGGSLRGTVTLTAGLGGMGGAQPLAVTMNEGVVHRDRGRRGAGPPAPRHRLRRPAHPRPRGGARDGAGVGGRGAGAVDRAGRQRRGGRARLGGRRRAVRRGHRPDLRARRPRAVRAGGDRAAPTRWRFAPRTRTCTSVARCARWPTTSARCSPSSVPAPSCSTTATTCVPRRRRRASPTPSTTRASSRRSSGPSSARAAGPFRWAALSGDPADILRTDRAVLELFPDDEGLRRWIEMAEARVPFQGLPAADLLAGLRRAGEGGARVQPAGRRGRGRRPDRHRPRPPRRGVGRIAQPRDRGDGRRLGRHRRLAAAQRAGQHRGRGDVGVDPPRRRRRHRLQPARRHGVRRRRHAAGRAEAGTGPDDGPGHGGRPARGRRVRARDRGRARAGRPGSAMLDGHGLAAPQASTASRSRAVARPAPPGRRGRERAAGSSSTGSGIVWMWRTDETATGMNATRLPIAPTQIVAWSPIRLPSDAAGDRPERDRPPDDEPHRGVHPALHPGLGDRLAERDLVDVPGDPAEPAEESRQRHGWRDQRVRRERDRQPGEAEPEGAEDEHPPDAQPRASAGSSRARRPGTRRRRSRTRTRSPARTGAAPGSGTGSGSPRRRCRRSSTCPWSRRSSAATCGRVTYRSPWPISWRIDGFGPWTASS